MDPNLTELLKKKQIKPDGVGAIDWDDRRDQYLAAVDGLYHQIETVFAEPIAQETVTPHRHPKQLTENYIGTYSIDDLILLIGNEQVRFSPAGRNIVSATGRVDVVGDRDEATLILQPGARWGFVRSRHPVLQVVPFDEWSLAEVLRLVMRD